MKKEILKKPVIVSLIKAITLPGGSSQNIGDANALTNVQLIGKEIVIDLALESPSLQLRKKIEAHVEQVLHDQIGENYSIQVHVTHQASPTAPQSNIIKGKAIDGLQNIVAIASGKGGVGKSTVTANLAVTLSNMGFKVGILDADIYGPSIPLMFDVAYERPLSVQVDGKSKMKPVSNYGVQLLSIGFFTKPDQAVIWRGPMASKALNQMIFDADWGELDFLLIFN